MAFIEIEKSVRTNNWSMHDLHWHDHYEIYFLSKGERSFFLADTLYHAKAPFLIVLPPRVMHKSEGGAFERYDVNVSVEYLDAFQKEVLADKSLRAIKPTPQETEELIRLLEELCSLPKSHRHSDEMLRALFSYLILRLNDLEEGQSEKITHDGGNVPPLVLKVLDHLNAHYAQPITLDWLAENFFVSKATLMYNFKKYTGRSPIDFLLSVRLEHAKKMLISTKKSINEIAEACGFSSANYFGLIFKKKENLSPVHYRKHQLNKG